MRQEVQTLDAQLTDVADQLESNSLRVVELFRDLYPHQLNLRPETHSWSIAECVVHLNLFSETFIPVMKEVSSKARSEGCHRNGALRMDVTGRLLKFVLEPPTKWHSVTTSKFEPLLVEPIEQVAPNFLELQKQLTELVEEVADLDLNRIRMVSPVSSRVRYNLYSCFLIIAAHQRRHLWQAEQRRTMLTQSQAGKC